MNGTEKSWILLVYADSLIPCLFKIISALLTIIVQVHISEAVAGRQCYPVLDQCSASPDMVDMATAVTLSIKPI